MVVSQKKTRQGPFRYLLDAEDGWGENWFSLLYQINVVEKIGLNCKIKIYAIASLLLLLLLTSCDDGSGEYFVGQQLLESDTNVQLLDTFSVKLSTVLLDTIRTAQSGCLLVGKYADEVSGIISVKSYFQVGIPEVRNITQDDHYDSLNLILRLNRYYFGDTTKVEKIYVHRLLEKIEPGEDGLTSASTFSFDPTPIGMVEFYPKPFNPVDTLSIKISDQIGQDFFVKIQEANEVLSDNTNFLTYFPGLVLVADGTYSEAIIGFSANEDDVRLVLTSHREDVGGGEDEAIKHVFKMVNPSNQFNEILHDFSGTLLDGLTEQKTALPSTNTAGISALQGGVGLAVRVDFPSLQDLLLQGEGKVVEAKLMISPIQNSYDELNLPSSLNAYPVDKFNAVVPNQTSIPASALTIDQQYHENTYYTFDITQYLEGELSDAYIDPEKGLLITLPYDELNCKFERVLFEEKNKNTKLKIYYLIY
ncbi:MAG: hypothetical protein Kow0037_25740 [Calditrichia bacterium]